MLKALSTLLGLITSIVLARTLGPASFGTYTFVMALVMVLSLPAVAGVPQLVIRETARGSAGNDWSLVKSVWRWSTAVVLVISLAMLLIVIAGSFVFPQYVGSQGGITLLVGLLLIPFMGLASVRSSSLRGLGYTTQGQLPELAIKPSVFLLLLACVALVGNIGEMTAAQVMALNVVSTVVGFVCGAVLLMRATPSEIDDADTAYQTRVWLAAIAPMAVINAMHMVGAQADVLLIGLLLDSTEVGHYKVAAQVSLVVAFGLQATKMVVEPQFSRLYHQGDTARLEALAQSTSRINLFIAVIVFALLLAFGPQLLRVLFGSEYSVAFQPLLILSVGRLAGACLGASGSVLVMAGYHREYAGFWMMSAALNVIFNLILIPLFGITGAALATAVTLLLPYVLGWWAARAWLGCDCSPFARAK